MTIGAEDRRKTEGWSDVAKSWRGSARKQATRVCIRRMRMYVSVSGGEFGGLQGKCCGWSERDEPCLSGCGCACLDVGGWMRACVRAACGVRGRRRASRGRCHCRWRWRWSWGWGWTSGGVEDTAAMEACQVGYNCGTHAASSSSLGSFELRCPWSAAGELDNDAQQTRRGMRMALPIPSFTPSGPST